MRPAEGGTESTLAQLGRTFPTSLGIFHIRAQTSALCWRSVKSLRSDGDKGVICLSVLAFGCLECQMLPMWFFFSSCFCELGSTWVGLVKEVLVKEIKGCKLPTLDWNLRSSFCFPSDDREEFLKQASVGLSFKSMLNQWWEALSLGCRCLTSIIVNVTVE